MGGRSPGIKREMTPQLANIIVLEVVIAMLARQDLNSEKLSDDERRELSKAKNRLLDRLRENLLFAKKQAA